MEVRGKTPPALPPKTKKAAGFQPREDVKVSTKETSVSIAPSNGHEVGSLKIVNNRRHDEDDFAPPQSFKLSEKRVTEPQSNKASADDRPLPNAGKRNGCESATKSAVPSPKIITWGATIKPEATSTPENFYENVSNGGMSYLETQLTNVANKSDVTVFPGAAGKRKTPKIEVRQEENKTVVKISIKDTPTPEEEMNGENRFGVDEHAYENGCQGSNGFISNVVYANCDKSDDEAGIYENGSFLSGDGDRCCENLSNGCYENVDSGERFYANVSETVGCFNRPPKKQLITEANYWNLNGDYSKCDQVYENREFQVSKNNVVSIIGKNCPPPSENSAEREDGDNDLYENVQTDYQMFSHENPCRSGSKPDEIAEKYESRKTTEEKKLSVVEVFLQKPTAMVKIEKSEAEYADDNSSGDPFDSGTCSDVDSLPNFVQNKKRNVIVTIKSLNEDKIEDKKIEPGHRRAESLTSSGVGVDSEESDDEKSNISCDSLNSNDPYAQSNSEDHGYHTPNFEDKTGSPIEYENVIKRASENQDKADIIQQVASVSQKIKNLRMENTGVYTAKLIDPSELEEYENVHAFDQPPKYFKKKPPPPPPPAKPSSTVHQKLSEENNDKKALPVNLLRDIRSRNVRLSTTYPSEEKPEEGKTSVADVVFSLERGFKNQKRPTNGNRQLMVEERTYEERKKVNKICAMEVDTDKFYKFHLAENVGDSAKENGNDEETFAGVKDYLCREKPAAITSAKGTIRGVKNRVKAGIATFLQLHENKSYKDRDAGKVVVYTTSMGIVRETYQKCLKVKQILKTLMIKFEERDVFMSSEAQDEIRDRMKCNAILVPQVFVEGQHIGTNMVTKDRKKRDKYRDLITHLRHQYPGHQVKLVVLIVGCLGGMKASFLRKLSIIPTCGSNAKLLACRMQKAAILGSLHILRLHKDAETIERLNEMGELRIILKPYKSADACSTCKVCGGYRLLPCSVCKGSKKSIHRNHFTAEFVALKCMNCDQVGLTKCYAC